MKKIILPGIFMLLLACLPNLLKAQQPDSVIANRIKFVSKDLSVKESQAKSVISILDLYKSKMQQVIAEKDLDVSERKTKIDALMDERNVQLAKILKPAQLQKITKATERDPQQRPPF